MPGLGLGRGLDKLINAISSVFSPSNIAGLELWGKFNDSTTLNAKMGADFTSASSQSLSNTSASLKTTTAFSVGCWFNVDGSGTTETIMNRWKSSGNNRSWLIQRFSDNKLYGFFSDNGTTQTGSIDMGAISTDTWYFIVLVWDGSANMKMSLNGSNFTTTGETASYGGTADFYIGGRSDLSEYFDGTIDGAFFYDKALTQAQVTALYNSGSGVAYDNLTADQLTSLVSWWELNETSGNRSDSHGANTLTDNNSVGFALGHIQEPIENNDYVWRWVDQSDNAFNIDQDTASSQGQYLNTKEIDFDGATTFYNLDAVHTQISGNTIGTIALWIKATDGTPPANEYPITFGDTNANEYLMMQIRTNGLVRFDIVVAGVSISRVNTAAASVTTGVWEHWAIVQNGTQLTIYKNGIDISDSRAGATQGAWFNNATGVDNGRLGCFNYNSGGNTAHFDGSMAEPIIYNTNLTADQISDLYNYSLSDYS
jgi:hypothetical protein